MTERAQDLPETGGPSHFGAFDLVAARPWAIQPEWLGAISQIAQRGSHDAIAAHLNMTPEALEVRAANALKNTRTMTIRDGVAVLPIRGPIFPRANMMTDMSGATSLQVAMRDFNAAIANDEVHSILIDLASPGGQIPDVAESAALIRASSKPVTAYVSDVAASAAYWLASAAKEIVVSETAALGSIGVVAMIPVQEEPNAQGMRAFEIVSSNAPDKRPDPRVAEQAAGIRATLDQIEGIFIRDVARFRGVSEATVKSEFGRGGVRIGADAVRVGMADRLGTFEETIGQINQRRTIMSQLPAAQAATTAELPAAASPSPVAGALEERARCKAIAALAGRYPGHQALADHLLETGASASIAESLFVAANADAEKLKGAAELERRRRELPGATAPIPPNAGQGDSPEALENLSPEERYERDPKVKAMFLSKENFVAYQRAVKAGRVRLLAPGLTLPRDLDPRVAA